MRDHMSKILVERSRQRKKKNRLSSDGRIFRNAILEEEDGGFAPHRLGIKQGYSARAFPSENFSPLKRWLASQVNRPWDKVYSEICANIDRRNNVQAHIFVHLAQFVAIETRLVDGKIVALGAWPRRFVPLSDEWSCVLFVHPVTRILLPNRERLRRLAETKATKNRPDESAKLVLADRNGRRELHHLDDAWFLVEFAPLPPDVQRWDVLRKQLVSREPPPRRYGRSPMGYDKSAW